MSLGEARVDRSGDCHDWSVLDALKACIRDIEAGKIKPDMVYIAMRETEDNAKGYPSVIAGAGRFEVRGLLWSHLLLEAKDYLQ